MTDEQKPSSLLPFVRHMLVCEHAEPSARNPLRTNVFGIFANAVVKGDAGSFPCSLGFSVYVMLSDCRRSGSGRVVVTEAESAGVCYNGIPFQIALSADPLEIHGLVFRIAECVIPRAGLYWIEFEFDGVSIGQEPILVKTR